MKNRRQKRIWAFCLAIVMTVSVIGFSVPRVRAAGPDTGESNDLARWGIVLGASAVVAVLVLIFRKRSNKDPDENPDKDPDEDPDKDKE